jgi:hypothetical protein
VHRERRVVGEAVDGAVQLVRAHGTESVIQS